MLRLQRRPLRFIQQPGVRQKSRFHHGDFQNFARERFRSQGSGDGIVRVLHLLEHFHRVNHLIVRLDDDVANVVHFD